METPDKSAKGSVVQTLLGYGTTGVLLIVVLAIAAVVVAFVLATTWAPIIAVAILWGGSYALVRRDTAPYERTRFAFALLVAWMADGLLYRLAIALSPDYFRHLVPGVAVASIYVGFLAWKLTDDYRKPQSTESINILAGIASLLLSFFLFFNVLAPTVQHFAPGYWSYITQLMSEESN